MLKNKGKSRKIVSLLVCNIMLFSGCESKAEATLTETDTTTKVDYTVTVTEDVTESEVTESETMTDTALEYQDIVQTDNKGETNLMRVAVTEDGDSEDRTDGGINVAAVEVVDDSEKALQALIVDSSGRSIEQSFYGDYNKNKTFELFATVKSEDGTAYDLWFTDGMTTLEVEVGQAKGTEADSYVYGTYNENGQEFDYVALYEPLNMKGYNAVKSLYTFDDMIYDLAGEYSTKAYEQYLMCAMADRFYLMTVVTPEEVVYPCIWEPTAHRFRLNNYEYIDVESVNFDETSDLQQHILNVIKWENGVYTLNFVEDFESYRSKSYIINESGECQFLSVDNDTDLLYGCYPETMIIEPIN